MWRVNMEILVITTLVMAVSVIGQSYYNEEFDEAFDKFLEDHGYRGGAVAAMKDGRLVHARGYGFDRQGYEVTANSHFQVSSLAKSLTAVAVMKLVQDGELGYEDKVFGDDGLLSDIQPWDSSSVDIRIYDITVNHLLRHGAGWDINKGPLYDPLLNEIYLGRQHNVPNIARDMGLEAPVSARELIQYTISHSLAFTPGTNVAYSNMAYLVLGRVIEQASGMEYRDYVKREILDRCGMWSTRLELFNELFEDSEENDPNIYELLDPVEVDSALGWYSNVYDLLRFSRCTFQQRKILDDHHLMLLLAPLESAPIQHSDTWHCAGFRTSTRGIVWQDSDIHADDLVLYHDLAHQAGRSGPPDTWVVLLYDKKINHLRHHGRELMALLDTGDDFEEYDNTIRENLFLYDLSDLHRHPKWEPWKMQLSPEYSIKYRLDEHHLTAYITAIRDEKMDLQWFTSFSVHGHTYFLVVSRRTSNIPTQQSYDYIFEHGLTHRSLLTHKLEMEELGYNLTQLHSYRSRSHTKEPTSFAAMFRPYAFSVDTQMKYGTGHLPEPYEKLVQMYHEKKFYPISQTVTFHDKDEQFSFIFVKRTSQQDQTDFKHYYDLTSTKLSKLIMDNALKNLKLTYLNSYDISGKFKFSAIFTNATTTRGLMEVEHTQDITTENTIANLQLGLVPRYVVPYKSDDKENRQLQLATYYEQL